MTQVSRNGAKNAILSASNEVNDFDNIAFRYFDSTGVEVTSVANANSVARIDLTLRASGLAGSQKGQAAPKDSLSLSSGGSTHYFCSEECRLKFKSKV